MRSLFLTNLELTDERGQLRSYDYYITVDEIDIGPFACESYGICIEEQGGTRALLRGVTVSMPRIDELSRLLIRNAVTPVTLADVVSDWL